jgi:nitric oxide reductase subunit B
MYWWFVVHLWVEGTWELILGSLLAFVLIKTTGVDREVIDKWLYVIIALALDHRHPGYRPPLLLHRHARLLAVDRQHVLCHGTHSLLHDDGVCLQHGAASPPRTPNQAAVLWAVGCSVVGFLGAGLWGFIHTLSPVNYYTHGTQITAAHGHLAFYGAYVMVVLAMISYAMPLLRGREANCRRAQNYEMWSFWIMTIGMGVMVLALTGAGILQVWLQRIPAENGAAMSFMQTQDQLRFFYWVRVGGGVMFLVGLLTYLYSFFAGPGKNEDALVASPI